MLPDLVSAITPAANGAPAAVMTDVVRSRRSCRAFAGTAVDLGLLEDILSNAARAPSGANIQPWHGYLVGPAAIARIDEAIHATGVPCHKAKWDDYRYYPKTFFEPYNARRKALGRQLYGLLGLERRDVKGMRAQLARNFRFFDAPAGLFVTIDRRLEQGSWIDLGMFMQNVLLLAEANGLATCVQAAFTPFHRTIRPILNMPDEEILVCGIAIGHPARSAPENAPRTDRTKTNDWLRFVP